MKIKEQKIAEYTEKKDEAKESLEKELAMVEMVLKMARKGFDTSLNSKALRDEAIELMIEMGVEKGKILQKLSIIDMLTDNIHEFFNKIPE